MINNRSVYKAGYLSAMISCIAMTAFNIVQLFQLLGILIYPLDQILIYSFSLCIVIPFLLSMIAVHCVAPIEKKFFSYSALLFSVVYVVFVSSNYVVQLATVIPMTMKGFGTQVQLLNQAPHSLFWDFDAIGYIFMGLAALFVIYVFEKTGFQKWVRYSFLAHALVTPLISFVYFYPEYSNRLLMLAIPWAVTAPLSMLILGIWFKKQLYSMEKFQPGIPEKANTTHQSY